MTVLETVLVTLGVALLVVELTRRLHGALHFLELDKTELLNVSRVLAVSLVALVLVYLLALTIV